MIPHVLKCASCAHCSGINVEITFRKWDMAWDKTSSSGRLAWRGPHTVIAHFTHPIHFHSSLSALLHGKKGSFPFLNHIFPEIHAITFFFPQIWWMNRKFMVGHSSCDFVIVGASGLFLSSHILSCIYVRLLSVQDRSGAHVERRVTEQQQLFQGGHCPIDFLILFFLSNNAQ